MAPGGWLLLFIALQRLAELALAEANTRRLLAAGGREHGREHYPLMVGFHALWLATLAVFGWDAPVAPGWVAAFALLQAARVWTIASLGRRWTTRIVTVPGPLVRRGPYRLMRHPNYAVVAGEIAVVPLALGLPGLALAFSLAHLAVLRVRVRAEERALAEAMRAGPDQGSAGFPHVDRRSP